MSLPNGNSHPNSAITSICCIGAGYVGGTHSTVLAYKCPDIDVTVVDINEEKIRQWNSEDIPIQEAGLSELVGECRGKNLRFSVDVAGGIRGAQLVFLAVHTPTASTGHGKGKDYEMQYVYEAARTIALHAVHDTIVVEKSTVPVKTADHITSILERYGRPGVKFQVLSNPEFLVGTTAVKDCLHPDKVLIGGPQTVEGRRAVGKLATLYRRWVPEKTIVTMDAWSSELTKLACNAVSAQRLSTLMAFSILSETLDIRVSNVVNTLTSRQLVGSRPLRPGLGWGGSCYRKDVMYLIYLCESLNLYVVANYLNAIVELNEFQKTRCANRVVSALQTVTDCRVAIVGFAYKSDSADCRESPAASMAVHLLKAGIRLNIYDPMVQPTHIIQELVISGDVGEDWIRERLTVVEDVYQGCDDVHALVVCTNCALFKKLDYQRIHDGMKPPKYLFDGWDFLDHDKLTNIGFRIATVGRNVDN